MHDTDELRGIKHEGNKKGRKEERKRDCLIIAERVWRYKTHHATRRPHLIKYVVASNKHSGSGWKDSGYCDSRYEG